MHADPIVPQIDPEDFLAELTEAAYGFALRHGFKGTFVEMELGLWDALRARQERISESASASPPTGPPLGPHIRVLPPTRQGTIDEAAPAIERR
jgi:hypothetical protein